MNLYHLRYFSTLAHIEHYTKAADILAITQPSLSYAISTLEEELGVKLFEKNGRNVTLTKYGKVFLNDVEEVLNRLDSSVNSLKLAGKGEGCIDVVFLRTLGIDFLPKIMRGFLEENPTKKIDFNLYCDKVLTSDILNGLKEKKYDLGSVSYTHLVIITCFRFLPGISGIQLLAFPVLCRVCKLQLPAITAFLFRRLQACSLLLWLLLPFLFQQDCKQRLLLQGQGGTWIYL